MNSKSSLADKAEYMADFMEDFYFLKRINLQGGFYDKQTLTGTFSLIILMLIFWSELYYVVYLIGAGGFKYGVIGAVTLTLQIPNLFLSILIESSFFILIFLMNLVNLIYFIYHKTKGGTNNV